MIERLTQSEGGGLNPTRSLHIQRLDKDFSKAREFVDKWHSYIKWTDRPSRKCYWLLYEGETLVGVFGLGSGFTQPIKFKELMKEKGWTFNQVANNVIFCLAGQSDRNAGTKFLSLLRRDAVTRWGERYGDELKCIQTFILPPRTGAVYKADNWKFLGRTRGGKTLRKQYYCQPREGARMKVFSGGEVKYEVKSYAIVESKLIFVWER